MKPVTDRVFIQARMTSARFPGKVLAPFAGEPLVKSVIERVRQVVPLEQIVLATSDRPSDDPLAAYAAHVGVPVFRGSLDDVFARFRSCLRAHPCDWFYRVCADSPLLNPDLLVRAAGLRKDGVDLVTNVFPRTFPKGQSVELLRSSTFSSIDVRTLTAEQTEHLTQVYYQAPHRFGIANFSADGAPFNEDLAVDSLDDLHRVSAFAAAQTRG